MKFIKTVFFTNRYSPFGLAHLKPLINSQFNIVCVVIPKRKIDIGFLKLYLHPVGPYRFVKNELRGFHRILKTKHIRVIKTEDVNNDDTANILKSLNVDLFISAGFTQILSKNILDIPKIGGINIHPSLLPKYRGSNPIFWVVKNKESHTGITAHWMIEKVDAGNILTQIKFKSEGLSFTELYKRTLDEVDDFVVETWKTFESGRKGTPQNESGKSYYKNPTKGDWESIRK